MNSAGYRNSAIIRIGVVFEYGIFLWMVTPYLCRNLSHSLIIGLFIGWLSIAAIVMLSNNSGRIHLTKSSGFLLLWLAYIFVYRILGISTASWGNYFHIFGFWLCFLIYEFNNKFVSYNSQKRLLLFIWIASMVSIINSTILIRVNPSIIDSMYRAYGSNYLNMNIGEAPYALYAVFFFFFNYIMFRIQADRRKNIFYITGMCVSVICIFTYQKASAVLVLFIVILLMMIYRPFSLNRYTRISRIPIFIIVVLIILVIFPSIVTTLDRFFGNNDVVSRLKDICNIVYGSSFSDASGSGMERYANDLISIRTWLSSIKTFLFGIGYATSDAFGSIVNTVGQHSEFCDTLARYGLVGSLLSFGALFEVFKSILSEHSKSEIFKCIYIGAFVYFIINTLTSNAYLGVSLFVLIPYSLQMKETKIRN